LLFALGPAPDEFRSLSAMQLTAWPPTRGVQMLMMLLPLAFLLRTETLGWLARWMLLCYAGAIFASFLMPPVSLLSLRAHINPGWTLVRSRKRAHH
jgi:hypothetical protein